MKKLTLFFLSFPLVALAQYSNNLKRISAISQCLINYEKQTLQTKIINAQINKENIKIKNNFDLSVETNVYKDFLRHDNNPQLHVATLKANKKIFSTENNYEFSKANLEYNFAEQENKTLLTMQVLNDWNEIIDLIQIKFKKEVFQNQIEIQNKIIELFKSLSSINLADTSLYLIAQSDIINYVNEVNTLDSKIEYLESSLAKYKFVNLQHFSKLEKSIALFDEIKNEPTSIENKNSLKELNLTKKIFTNELNNTAYKWTPEISLDVEYNKYFADYKSSYGYPDEVVAGVTLTLPITDYFYQRNKIPLIQRELNELTTQIDRTNFEENNKIFFENTQLQTLDQNIKLINESLDKLEKVKSITLSKLRLGKISYYDLKEITNRISKNQIDLISHFTQKWQILLNRKIENLINVQQENQIDCSEKF